MSFNPNQPFKFAGYDWQFDTPQAYQNAQTAAANTDSGRFDYNLGLGPGWNDAMLQALGYGGPSPFASDYTNSVASENGQLESLASGQAQAGQQAFKDFLNQKGYSLGTTYGQSGPGGVLAQWWKSDDTAHVRRHRQPGWGHCSIWRE